MENVESWKMQQRAKIRREGSSDSILKNYEISSAILGV